MPIIMYIIRIKQKRDEDICLSVSGELSLRKRVGSANTGNIYQGLSFLVKSSLNFSELSPWFNLNSYLLIPLGPGKVIQGLLLSQ